MKKCIVCKIITLLGGLGALNWGLVALFDVNLVSKALGEATTASTVVYTLIGVAGLLLIVSIFKCCPCVKKSA